MCLRRPALSSVSGGGNLNRVGGEGSGGDVRGVGHLPPVYQGRDDLLVPVGGTGHLIARPQASGCHRGAPSQRTEEVRKKHTAAQAIAMKNAQSDRGLVL